MWNRSVSPRAEEPTVPVWDRVVRVFHWTTVALVTTAFLTTDSPRWLHQDCGYAVLVLVAVRIVWGIVGPGHARFTDFVQSPRSVLTYLKLLREGRAPRYMGHNPAGGAMIVALMVMLIIVAGSGWLSETNAYFGVPWVDHLHHISAHLLLLMIGVHLTGVVVSSWLHKENLVRAMITGRKPAESADGTEAEGERRTAAIAHPGSD